MRGRYNRMATWRGSLSCATLWLLLASASALEVYDEVPQGDSDLNDNQDDNHLGAGPDQGYQKQSMYPPEHWQLYEIIKALHQKTEYRKPWSSHFEPELLKEDFVDPGLEKDAGVKRLAHVLSGSRMQYRPSIRPQRKWKIKKGKVAGSQMVCYFKLCAFRAPA